MDRRTYFHIGMHIDGKTDGRTDTQTWHQTYGRTEIFKHIHVGKIQKKVSRVNTRTNGLFICVHTSAVSHLVSKHTHPRINIEVRSKKFEVRNKEYHGHAYMYQT